MVMVVVGMVAQQYTGGRVNDDPQRSVRGTEPEQHPVTVLEQGALHVQAEAVPGQVIGEVHRVAGLPEMPRRLPGAGVVIRARTLGPVVMVPGARWRVVAVGPRGVLPADPGGWGAAVFAVPRLLFVVAGRWLLRAMLIRAGRVGSPLGPAVGALRGVVVGAAGVVAFVVGKGGGTECQHAGQRGRERGRFHDQTP